MDEIPYWRDGTLEKYTPSGDYVVVKFARWAFEKFEGLEDKLVTRKTHILEQARARNMSRQAARLGVADRIYMLENSIYSVISPEGCAAILWRDGGKAEQAATAMKITAADALRIGAIDAILDEPLGGAHRDVDAMAERLRKALSEELGRLQGLDQDELVEKRYRRLMAYGQFTEVEARASREVDRGRQRGRARVDLHGRDPGERRCAGGRR